MKRIFWRIGCLLLVAGNVGACASVSTGTSQTIAVTSDPTGATCTLMRGGETIGSVTTPAPALVKRTSVMIEIHCKKDGYEEGKAFMPSRFESSTIGNVILGGVVGLAVDAASGAMQRYDTSVNVILASLSGPAAPAPAVPGEQPAAVATRKSEPPPSAPAVASAQRGPYDGTYEGSVDVLQTNVQPYVPHQRVFAVRVVNGVGTGTVKHALCDEPGEVFFLVEPSGRIKGKANTRNTTGCTDRFAMVEGQVDDGVMHLTLRLINNPQFALTRSSAPPVATPVAAAAPASVTGPFDGSYRGGLEVAQGDLRQLWVRVRGTKATGTSRVALCPTPGAISMNIDATGVISGEADLQTSASCNPRKATLAGHAEGKRLVVMATFADGSQAREVSFNRESKGVGVDD